MSIDLNDVRKELNEIMAQNNVKESDKPSFITAFALGMMYAKDKFVAYAATNNLLKEASK